MKYVILLYYVWLQSYPCVDTIYLKNPVLNGPLPQLFNFQQFQFNVSSQDMLQLHMYTHMHVCCRQVIAWEIIPECVRRDVLLLSHYKQR